LGVTRLTFVLDRVAATLEALVPIEKLFYSLLFILLQLCHKLLMEVKGWGERPPLRDDPLRKNFVNFMNNLRSETIQVSMLSRNSGSLCLTTIFRAALGVENIWPKGRPFSR
jgi:predicted ferric reductase